MADETTTIIEKLGGLSGKLSAGDDTARSEALQLSRLLTSSLEKPATTAVDLAFAVSDVTCIKLFENRCADA